MAISSELFLSLLALDAYNRGYDAGLGSTETGLGLSGQIGSATIGQARNDAPARNDSFFAISYTFGNTAPAGLANSTIISYRGTDNLPPALGGTGDWRDVAQWRQMVGSFDTPQQKLAA
jgi:hypothetical protein